MGQPICRIRHYDEFDGLSQRLVKQAVQDATGMMWFATWNGLNRFDGYEFITVKPQSDDSVGIYSDRMNDIKLMATGNLLCRVDNRCVVFDVRTHRFSDFLTAIERRMGRRFGILKLCPATDGTTALECEDGVFLTFDDNNPAATATLSHTRPAKKYRQPTNLQYDSIGGIATDDLLYARSDRYGTIWVVTREGDIYHTDAPGRPLTRYPENIDPHGPLYYSTTDDQGNVWLRSNYGVYELTFGRYPYRLVPQAKPSQIRCMFRDSGGRTWFTGYDDATVRVTGRDGNELGYLGRDGQLHREYTVFGTTVYSMAEDTHRQLWLGTKPDGLFRLRGRADGFDIAHFNHRDGDRRSLSGENVYDLRCDGRGRLWIATMKGGLNCIEDTRADNPVFINTYNGLRGYPDAASSARRIAITRDGTMFVATTGGLVAADTRTADVRRMRFRLHTREAGRTESLGSVALMDVLEDSRGRIFVATESGGVDRLTGGDALEGRLTFDHYNASNGRLSTDIAYSLSEYRGRIYIVSNNSLVAFNPDNGTSATYNSNYWKRRLRFSDAHPLNTGRDGRWLFSLQDGCIEVCLDSLGCGSQAPRITITGIAVQNRMTDHAVTALDTLVLKPDERNVRVHFAALCYDDAAEIDYAFRMDGSGGWNNVGKTRSATFLDMEPGTYRLMIRSTDSNGQWQDNVRTLTIIVTPTFWETGWAYLLYVVLTLGVLLAIARTVVYVRTIKRKQRETLAAYLKLLDERQTTAPDTPTPAPPQADKPALNDEDEQMMKRVMDFVEAHIADPDVNITDMASAAAVSKSGLNRKLKSILGVTPAEFMRETRLQRAASLLTTTQKAVSDIALECGFADQNYFGKCFKARHGVTPTEYRRLDS